MAFRENLFVPLCVRQPVAHVRHTWCITSKSLFATIPSEKNLQDQSYNVLGYDLKGSYRILQDLGRSFLTDGVTEILRFTSLFHIALFSK